MTVTEYEDVEARKAKETAVLRDQWVADVQNKGTLLGLEAWVISRNRLRELQRILDTAAKGQAWNCVNSEYVPLLMELIMKKASINGDEQMESVYAESRHLSTAADAIMARLAEVRQKHVAGLP